MQQPSVGHRRDSWDHTNMRLPVPGILPGTSPGTLLGTLISCQTISHNIIIAFYRPGSIDKINRVYQTPFALRG